MHSESLPRRKFVKQAGVVGLGFMALWRCTNAAKKPETSSDSSTTSTKPVFPSMQTDPNNYMDLLAGFQYKIISKAGEAMDDGFLLPGRPDGMGAFRLDDQRVILVRNHENSPTTPQFSAFGPTNELLPKLTSDQLYDAGQMTFPGLGGTTTFVYNEETQQIEKQYLSLAGTYRNCAGGITPWGSWLTCEEDVTKKEGKIEKDHGYVFEVPASAEMGLAEPKPIKEMGRFNHEAVCVDPATGIVYQTEDRGNGLIYRFIPNEKDNLHAGGRLQMLAVKGQPSFDTRNWEKKTLEVNQTLEVEWMDVENADAPEDNLRLTGFEQGAACFARGEGMWFGEQEMYFACTNGGKKMFGQVFRYVPSPFEGTEKEAEQPGKLELFAESEDSDLLQMCDNLTIAPWGDVILCEDNGDLNYIRGIRPNGEMYTLGCNRSSGSEFAGAVFSPSGKTLFVNIQENGETLAITGPWESLNVAS
ncbi:MAG: PhoX family protein [Saprospiraceae bacterium]|nr:PhoX family protein [Saprospiraceae bacterium]